MSRCPRPTFKERNASGAANRNSAHHGIGFGSPRIARSYTRQIPASGVWKSVAGFLGPILAQRVSGGRMFPHSQGGGKGFRVANAAAIRPKYLAGHPISRVEMLVDAFGREVTDIRVSVTKRCNFGCIYCHVEGLGSILKPRMP